MTAAGMETGRVRADSPAKDAIKAIGLDIGGTKIEAQVFGDDWAVIARSRVPTPAVYADLLAAVSHQVAWGQRAAEHGQQDQQASPSRGQAGHDLPVGIGCAGLVHPTTGVMTAANLAAHGQAFPADIERSLGRGVAFLNDCRALALSEAMFGAGRGHVSVLALILGTGVSGGAVLDGRLQSGGAGIGGSGLAGEIGHMAASAAAVARFDLPVFECGCGRRGCVETYVSGPGLMRICAHLTGLDLTPEDIARRRHSDLAQVWAAWCAVLGDLVQGLSVTVDPDVIVLGGGLSKIDGVAQDITASARAVQIAGFDVPEVVVAKGGDASGARGAAYAAWRAQR